MSCPFARLAVHGSEPESGMPGLCNKLRPAVCDPVLMIIIQVFVTLVSAFGLKVAAGRQVHSVNRGAGRKGATTHCDRLLLHPCVLRMTRCLKQNQIYWLSILQMAAALSTTACWSCQVTCAVHVDGAYCILRVGSTACCSLSNFADHLKDSDLSTSFRFLPAHTPKRLCQNTSTPWHTMTSWRTSSRLHQIAVTFPVLQPQAALNTDKNCNIARFLLF